tara:strand:- start:2398 stop:2733 length:336 start_codon:yes stop_codon:yes gene_type:complete
MDICPICRQSTLDKAVSLGYIDEPFIDGKRHQQICWDCANVPKMWHYDENKDEVIVYDEFDPKRLHTAEEMVSDGWELNEAKEAIRAVRKAIRNSKKKPTPKKRKSKTTTK